MYALGIDSGTQGTKALVIDFNRGRVLGRGHAPHAMIPGLKPGESEQEPALWSKAMEKALAMALKESGIDPRKIVAIGVSGQQHGFVPLDRHGEVLRPAKLWNDTSTIEETEWLIDKLGGKRSFTRKLGIQLAVGFTASKILWLKRHEPEKYANLETVLLPHNYLNFHLTGKLHMEYGDASGTGLMDIRKLRWHPEVIQAIDETLEKKIPPLCHPSKPVGYLRKEIATRFGFGSVLVAGGGGDNMMGAIGTGNVVSGVCSLSLGTSGTIYAYFDKPFSDPRGEIAAFCDSTGGWLPLLCTMNVTNTSEKIKDLFRLTNKRLDDLADKVPPGSEGLIFLPFLDGERVPVLPESSAVFFGLNRKTFDAAHLSRAVMEGTIFNLGYGFRRMRSLGLNPIEIRATGGGAKSRLWLQIVADILQTPVVTLRENEAAAYGGALQAIWCYLMEKGQKVAIREITDAFVKKTKLTVLPDRKNFRIYEDLQERFHSLWKRLTPEFQAHVQSIRTK